MPEQRITPERFFSKVHKTATCWLWTGSKSRGYGVIYVATYPHRKRAAHRWFFEVLNGPLPNNLQLDHLCRNRACVRPDHLEVVTCGENIRRGLTGDWQRRKTRCPQGHLYSTDNTILNDRGHRKCRACVRVRDGLRVNGWERQRLREQANDGC